MVFKILCFNFKKINPVPHTINRNALIIYPKPALYQWVNEVFPKDKITAPKSLGHDDANIYLIPSFDHPDEALKFVKKNYLYFLKNELNQWAADGYGWPENLSWELFNQWFHFTVQSMVMVTIEEPLGRVWY